MYALSRLKLRKVMRDNRAQGINLVMDVDGVLTDGKFHYSIDGKIQKTFGSHDSDALKLVSSRAKIYFISADQKGFDISKKRVEDMGYELLLVSALERGQLVAKLSKERFTVFVGDSFTDVEALLNANFSMVPRNGHKLAKKAARIRLRQTGGDGAVAEVCGLLFPDDLRKS